MTEAASPSRVEAHPPEAESEGCSHQPLASEPGLPSEHSLPASKQIFPTLDRLAAEIPGPRSVPNFGDAVLFTLIAAFFIFFVEAAVFGVALGLHMLPRLSADQMVREPKLVVPAMALAYALALLASSLVFPLLWDRGFLDGIRWNAAAARRLGWRLPLVGVALGLAVQLLQNCLPMPRSVPMDDYFKTRPDIWIVTAFGVLLAPVFEEIAFRGMLLPAIANAWGWIARRAAASTGIVSVSGSQEAEAVPPSRDRVQPVGALVASSVVTSAIFALLHAEQLGHSPSPLALLFCVGLALALVRIRTSSVAASALVHASYNFSVFAAMFVGTGGYQHLERLKP